jgi:hypothetical protein
MKHVFRLIWLVIPAFLLLSCSEDDGTLQKESVQFTFDLKQLADEGGRVRSANEIPSGARLLVSIKTNTDVPVLTYEEVELLRLGDAVISRPIELAPGSYKLTDFMLVDASDEILFATPRKNSAMAKYVGNPLDVSFKAAASSVKNIPMEVMDVSTSTPADFGYASFSINVVHPLQLGVFVAGTNGVSLTSATAYIIKDNIVLQQFDLGARINYLSFKQDPAAAYKLKIVKKGHGTIYQDFVYEDVIEDLNGSPWTLTMTPAFTMLAYIDIENAATNEFSFGANASSGNLSINWGDGTIEDVSMSEYGAFIHAYPSSGNYLITITGDLNKIQDFYSYYGLAMIDEIDPYQLTGLQDFRLGLTRSPRSIDLSRSLQLRDIDVTSALQLQKLTIPNSPFLTGINVDGKNQMTAATINDLVAALHSNIVSNNIHGGFFSLRQSFYDDEGRELMIGPPSAASLTLLAQMRDEYGWEIFPEF